MKIAIFGYSGAGKSTLAKILSEHYHCQTLYLDQVQFMPGWKERDKTEARQIVQRFLNENQSWVIEGNYPSFCQEERLEQADQIICLKFNRFTCFRRAYRRFCSNEGQVRDSMAPGCEEKFDFEFAKWILRDGRNRKCRRYYRAIIHQYPQKTKVLKNQRQVDAYLSALGIQPHRCKP